ncbi:hypothetical protein ACWD5R_21405 [Streptomyces sp. NPDC002514]|uniref:hypothetical protein n=1 Tax=unclassified Streptomyces TaxID=2593676 RepID=UPI003681621F
MTGPGVPHEQRPLARAGTAAQRRFTGGARGAGSSDGPAEGTLATHKPCPVDDCPGPARVPMRSAAHPPAPEHGKNDHDTVLCRRCGAGPCEQTEV